MTQGVEQMSEPTARRFLRSAGAATYSQFWRVGVTFLTNLALRRLVPVEDWGLYVYAEVLFLVLGAVRDLGLHVHTVRVHPRPYGTLLLVEALWGGSLAGLACLAAPILALGLAGGHAEVVPVLRALSVFLFLEGLAVVPLTHFEGELRVGRVVLPEILRNLCYATVAVTAALAGWGVWSLVAAQLVASMVFAASLWSRAWGEMQLTRLKGGTLRLIRSSYPLALIWFLILLVRYVDRLIVGGRFSPEVLGVYEFGYWAAFIVPMILIQPIGRAAFPAFVAFRNEPRKLFEAYRLSTIALLAIEVPTALFLFLNAERVLEVIGGSRWSGSAQYLRVLCFAPLLDPFSRLGGEVLGARHRDRWWIAATLMTLVSFGAGGMLLTGWLGPLGMAWANYLPLGGFFMAWTITRWAPGSLQTLAADLARVYLLPVPFFAAVAFLAPDRPDLRLGLSLLALLASLAATLGRFGTDFRAFFFARPHPGDGSPDSAQG